VIRERSVFTPIAYQIRRYRVEDSPTAPPRLLSNVVSSFELPASGLQSPALNWSYGLSLVSTDDGETLTSRLKLGATAP
jgi:hypothetical protein